MFGSDGLWGYFNGSAQVNSLRQLLFPCAFAFWGDSALAGVLARGVGATRGDSHYGFGFRPAMYLVE